MNKIPAASFAILPFIAMVLPEPLRAILSIAWIVFMLIGLGRLVEQTITCLTPFESRYALWFPAGVALYLLAALFANSLNLLEQGSFTLLVWVAAVIGLGLGEIKLPQIDNRLVLLAIVAIASLLPFAFLRLNSPYPYQANIDMFTTFLPITNELLAHNYLDLNTYAVNLPSVALLAATASKAFTVSALGFYYYAPLALYALTAIGVFLLAEKISGNKWHAAGAALAAVFFTGWGTTADPIFFIPRNLAALLLPYALVIADNYRKDADDWLGAAFAMAFAAITFLVIQPIGDPTNFTSSALFVFPRQQLGILIPLALAACLTLSWLSLGKKNARYLPLYLACIALVLTHTYLGLLAAFLTAALPFTRTALSKSAQDNLLKIFLALILLGLAGWPLLEGALSALNPAWPVGNIAKYSFSSPEKLVIALQVFSFAALAIAVLGAAAYYFDKRADKAWLLALLGISAFAMLPLPFTFRAMGVVVPLVAIMAAYPLTRIRTTFGRPAAAGALLIFLLIAFQPVYSFAKFNDATYAGEGSVSGFSPNDLAASRWLEQNTGDNDFILSDPSTQSVYSALSGKTATLTTRVQDDRGQHPLAYAYPPLYANLKTALGASSPTACLALKTVVSTYANSTAATPRSHFYLIENCKSLKWLSDSISFNAGSYTCTLEERTCESLALHKVFEIKNAINIYEVTR